MSSEIDLIHKAFHDHIAGQIEQATQPGTEDHDSHHYDWMKVAASFAGHVAMDLISDYVSMSLLTSHLPHVALDQPSHDHSTHDSTSQVGIPSGDGFTHQTTAFTCALVSQKMILDQFGVVDHRTGEPVSEAMLVFEATNHGWLTEHGTSLGDMANLLELHGVPCHHGHDWQHLVRDLAHGHQVAIAVNSDELWNSAGFKTLLNEVLPGHPDHAVVLKGLRVDDHGHVSVVINDPGQSDGAGVEYSLDKFQAALGNGDFHYVATDHSPSGWQPDTGLQGALSTHEGYHFDDGHSAIDEAKSYTDWVDHLSETERIDFLRNL